VAVTLAYRGGQILRGFDDDLRAHLAAALVARGIDLRLNTDLAALAQQDGAIRATFAGTGAALDTDLVLFATGRVPQTQGLGLAAAQVPLGARGQVLVDDYSQTAVPSIFAVGDVTDQVNLTPVAIRQGHAFADTVFRGQPRRVDLSLVPSAVFTTPELASVGLTEAAAAAQGRVDVYQASFRPMRSLFAGRGDRMLMKLVVDAASQRVLGCHIAGEGAAELVQMAAIALTMGATKADFDATIALHPTVAEELVTLRKPTRSHGGPQGGPQGNPA
jgi:glutathione reductase (NADPH)